ncbi:MAG: sulfite exporter TauE/SafE family protein [Burkholderiales bacterium]|nr:sulfite exporter TauE/SafE family protein [Bacteroidia bacterium]
MIIVGLIAFLIIGMILGLIGGGGSLLGVPVLVYVMCIDADLATTYSLFIVGITAMVGAISYVKKGEVSAEAILNFALASVTTVFCMRKFIMPIIPSEFSINGFAIQKNTLIMVVFALLILSASYSMIISRKPNRIKDVKWNEFTKTPLGIPFVILLGVIIGLITGFVGAGGGFIIVPVLMIFMRLNFKKAIGTSLCIVALNSIIGFLGNIGHQNLDWKFLLMISSVCGIGILLGSVLSNKVPSKKLKPAFGWFTLVVGIFVLVKELFL